MSQYFAEFSLAELILDPEGVSEALNRACRRAHTGYCVSGHFQHAGVVVFILEPRRTPERPRYWLAPMAGESREDWLGELRGRWQGGWSTLGILHLEECHIGLFETHDLSLPSGAVTA